MESKMQFQSITFEEYNKIRKLLLVGSEAIREEVYRDSRGIATIGIGINIGGNNLKGLWIKLILYYFFGLTKKLKDIPFTQFDDYKYTFNNIIKDTTSYKYEEYKTLIDNISAQMLKTLQTDIKTSTLNTIIQDNIKDYINETKKKQKQNPNSNLEQLQRLSEEDLKITKDSQRNNQYLEFKLNEQQAEELFNIMAINYEAITLKHFNNKDITHFNKIKEEKESNKEYYKEFIPFLSATYQAPNSIKNNTLIQKAFISKSRFLIWAVLRYDLGSDIRRRILQSAIFNFNAKLDNQIENDEEKFNTCIDIFKTLNLLEENTDTNKQTHLQYFREQELERKKREDGKAGNNMQEIMKSEVGFCKGKPNLESCKIYHSNVINPSELEPLMNLLNPYVKYLDSLIPSAKFENNADFNKFTLESDAQESTTQSDSNLYRFKPQNIYVLNNNNHHEVLNAMREYNATKDTSNENPNNTKEITKDSKDSNNTNKDSNNQTNKTENLLLIITEAIHEELKIQKPINTYLYIVQNKAICNTIDCALLNNPLRNSTKENDKCELYTYEEQENNKPNMNSLATTTSLQLQEKDNTLESKENNYTYSFDILNHLNIKQDHQTFFVLSNYRFYLEEMYNNININNNPNIYLGSTNTTNFNQDSTNSTYITQTILQPNIAYSTLGIQLKTSKPQDTFNNNGNFNIKLTNIDFKSIESITNHSITKDSPIFIYTQDSKSNNINNNTNKQNKTSKTNFITKLQDTNTLSLNINLNTNITRDEYNNINLIDTQYLFLSFIPFRSKYEANNTISQKLQITSQDLNNGTIQREFMIPNVSLRESEMVREWKQEVLKDKIVEVYFSYGEECSKVEEYSKCQDDMNLHIVIKDCSDGEEVEINIKTQGEKFRVKGVVQNGEVVFKNILKDKKIWRS